MAVVAHYDDAVIWAGGTMRRTLSLGWDWTIVTTCAAEEHRRKYFMEWCESLGVRPVALLFKDHPDGGPFSQNDRKVLCDATRNAVRSVTPDWVFTHSLDADGEYGPHPNHAEAAEAVASLARDGILSVNHVAQFAYRRIYRILDLAPVARGEASHYVQLDYDDLAWKAEWCARARDVELRDPTLGGVSWLEKLGWPCPNPEAFAGEGLLLPVPFISR
jgi:LmbE family N-acetylglucosaminyl deacetylase